MSNQFRKPSVGSEFRIAPGSSEIDSDFADAIEGVPSNGNDRNSRI
jgi:hypothetical protein